MQSLLGVVLWKMVYSVSWVVAGFLTYAWPSVIYWPALFLEVFSSVPVVKQLEDTVSVSQCMVTYTLNNDRT